ncbi:hypothetical protein MVEN_01482700 [Mycena venus]|uniref:Phosphoglycerate mutase-like protein n=1 Tax=Mycena venus TaxID=2733690 RepID=A0A8H7CTA6_9AGAR|nr:hypothetical protein MVEN_01482700 [Mycena venus]
MLTVTFIRHGQSEDNIEPIWAGSRDAALSELGVKASTKLHHIATAFFKSDTKFDVIYSSNLSRAHATGQAVLGAHSLPKPRFISDKRLQEQNFGIAEGQPWVILKQIPRKRPYEEMFAKKNFPLADYNRDQKFPEGESLNDLARRAESAIADCMAPHLAAAAQGDIHIAIVSHGGCISELAAALLRLDPDSPRDVSYEGLLNTAWTRAVVSLKDVTPTRPLNVAHLPPLTVEITDVNNSDHLVSLEAELERRKLREVEIVASTENLTRLTIPKIHLQLGALRIRGVPDILPNSTYSLKREKVEALKAALDIYLADKERFPLPVDPEADLP